MRESTELKETILHQAEELFAAQGFAGTSIKQIANASGCTTAALYYYFPDGKSQLLREVVQCSFSSKRMLLAEVGQDAASLSEWLRAFGRAAMRSFGEMQRRDSWLEVEMHQLGPVELAALQEHGQLMHQALTKQIARFVSEQGRASRLAWMLMCAVFGYGQLFLSRGVHRLADFDVDAFVEALAETVGCAGE